jgi:hypothetical protein
MIYMRIGRQSLEGGLRGEGRAFTTAIYGSHPSPACARPHTPNLQPRHPSHPCHSSHPTSPVTPSMAHPDVLHDDVDVRRRLDHLVQADDVGVHEEAQDLDLAADWDGVWVGWVCMVREWGRLLTARACCCRRSRFISKVGLLRCSPLLEKAVFALGTSAPRPPHPHQQRRLLPPRGALTLLLHVHGLDLSPVEDLDGHLVAGEDVLCHLDLRGLRFRGGVAGWIGSGGRAVAPDADGCCCSVGPTGHGGSQPVRLIPLLA